MKNANKKIPWTTNIKKNMAYKIKKIPWNTNKKDHKVYGL
jgi:hypothetical protein